MKMNQKTKILLLIVLFGGLLGGSIGLYLWFKPVPGIESLDTEISIPANDLFLAYEANENTANDKYLNKVVEVTGLVREIKTNEAGFPVVVLETDDMMFGVICEFESKDPLPRDVQAGALITIKGLCNGKLLDVVLNRSVFIN